MNDTAHHRKIAFYSLNLVFIYGLCVLSTPNAFAQPNDDPPIHEDSVGYCSDLKKGFNRNAFERLDELSAFPRTQYAAYLHNLSKTNWRNCLHNYIAIRKSIEKVDSDFLQSWVDEDLERNLNHSIPQKQVLHGKEQIKSSLSLIRTGAKLILSQVKSNRNSEVEKPIPLY